MSNKVLIVEDNPRDYEDFRAGVKRFDANAQIYPVNVDSIIKNLNRNSALEGIPPDINIFIIDVSLLNDKNEPRDELGLRFLLELKASYKYDFVFIIISKYDRADFKLITNVNEVNYIQKTDYFGSEMSYKVSIQLKKLLPK